jgi:hypothetical protein
MPLFGTLSTMPLTDLLQWLASARLTGTLQIERNKVSKSIVFHDGQVIGCSSDDPPERLGQFLIARGKISEEQLCHALTIQESSGRHLGMTLVEMGALSPDELSEHLEAKAEETIFSLFGWDDAVFRFQQGTRDEANVFPISLRVEDVLLRGLKRYDEIQRIREVLYDTRLVLRRTAKAPPQGLLERPMARALYESVDGDRTVDQILLHVHGSEYVVTKFLFELYQNGFVEIVGVKKIEPVATRTDPAGPESSTAGVEAAPDLPDFSDLTPPDIEEPAESVASQATAPNTGPPTPPSPAETAPAPSPKDLRLPVEEKAEPVAPAPPAAGPETAPSGSPAPAPATTVAAAEPELYGDVEISGGLELAEKSDAYQLAHRLEAARIKMRQGEYELALDILDAVYKEHPGDESLRRLTAESEAAFIEKAYRHFLPPNRILRLTRPVEDLQTEGISPTEFFLLSRVDGTWDVKSIVQIAPLREADTLRTLKRMREAGVIELIEPSDP